MKFLHCITILQKLLASLMSDHGVACWYCCCHCCRWRCCCCCCCWQRGWWVDCDVGWSSATMGVLGGSYEAAHRPASVWSTSTSTIYNARRIFWRHKKYTKYDKEAKIHTPVTAFGGESGFFWVSPQWLSHSTCHTFFFVPHVPGIPTVPLVP